MTGRVEVSSANMHPHPGDEAGEKWLKGEGNGAFRSTSSLTREDARGGACELVWVEEIEIS